ncbi:MAG: hypothetical protein JWM21_3667 [Acidobacteria bacterium]|nr:hypothetical protein [Acidobacteriota bacterium]
MDQFINALPALLGAAGGAQEVIEAAALAVWNHVAGEGLRQQTRATCLDKQRLIVAVSDSVWQHQLELMSSQFLFRLNALLGQGTVRFIEFRVDPKTVEIGRERNPQQQKIARNKQALPQPISLELVSAAALIHDPDLRRSFLGAAHSCVRRRESNHDDRVRPRDNGSGNG